MDYSAVLTRLDDHFRTQSLTFTPTDYRFLAGKDTPRDKFLGILTPEYYRREKLWQSGTLVWGYVFRTYMDNALTTSEKPYCSWVLFSPVSAFNEGAEPYRAILEKLESLRTKKPHGKRERLLKYALTEPYSEPQYLELPTDYTDGRLVFVSMIYVRPSQLPDFHLGLIPLMINKLLTKEAMYLPEMYWTDEFKEGYFNRSNV